MKYLSALLLILIATGCTSGQKSYCDLVETDQQIEEKIKETSKKKDDLKKKSSPEPL